MGSSIILIICLTLHGWVTISPPRFILLLCLLMLCLSALIVLSLLSLRNLVLLTLFLFITYGSQYRQGTLSLYPRTICEGTCRVLEDSNLSSFGSAVTEVLLTSVTDARGVRASCSVRALLFSEELLFQGESLFCGDLRVREEEGRLFISCTNPQVSGSPLIVRLRRMIKQKTEDMMRKRLPDSAPILSLMLFSYPSTEGNELTSSAREKGVSHIFVLSGFHLQLIAGSIEVMTGKHRRLRFISLGGAHLYALIAGYTPSLSRALISITLMKTASIRIPSSSLLITFIIHGLLVPHHLFSYAALLSYTAVAAIILVYPALRALLFSCLPSFLLTPLTLSFAVSWVLSPLSLILFGELHPEGILYTIILSPLLLPLFLMTFLLIICPFLPLYRLHSLLLKAIQTILSVRNLTPVTSWVPLCITGALFLTWFLFQWYCSRILQKRSTKRYELDVSLRLAFRDTPPPGRELTGDE